MNRPEVRPDPRYGRYAGMFALFLLLLVTINTIVTKPNGARGIAAGHELPPFAVPLATGTLSGDADVATAPDEGALGRVPACQERGAQILNVCQLYEHTPLVLALFVDEGSCQAVLGEMQALVGAFPEVSFAAVAIKGHRSALRKLIRARGLSMPLGIDSDGALASLYKVASCPQVTFALPGGVVQSAALLTRPSPALLRERVRELVAVARAHGWRGPGA